MLLLFVLALAVAFFFGHRQGWIPPQHDPLAPLDLRDPPGLTTGLKLWRLQQDARACTAALQRSGLAFTPVADRREGEYCGFENVVALERTNVTYSRRFRVTCPLAAALFIWEHSVVQPAARRYLDGEVVRIDHAGSYACRRVYGRERGRPSQHATANALDVTAFRFADGDRVTVLGSWSGTPAEQAFLKEVHDGGCGLFRGVLGPDYNAAHRDHFHLDMGPYYNLCR